MSRYKIVMLPTNEASTLVKTHNIYLEICEKASHNRELAQSQHLYIVDTEATIERNDWVMSNEGDIKCVESPYGWENWNKMLASTDTSFGLPTIPQHLIEEYVKNPNLSIYRCFVAPDNHLVVDYEGQDWPSLADLRIEEMYCFDLGNKIDVEFERYKQLSKPQVDFDLLKDFISGLKAFGESEKYANSIRNAVLFFELEEVKRIINK